MPPAELLLRFKTIFDGGAIAELVVWQLSQPVPPALHCYKYRAAYIEAGVRVLGFDNERGKGDHCHVDGREQAYAFGGVEQLAADFSAAVAARRNR